MADTVDNKEQVVDTQTTDKTEEKVDTQSTETNAENNQPFKIFETQEEFNKHSAGILNSAQKKAEKEILAMLGLKADEKDKLAKFKEAYDNTLSEAEKQAKTLENLNNELKQVKDELTEKDAIIAALSHLTGKKSEDVSKLVKMARGLVDENTTIEKALEEVFSFTKKNEPIVSPPLGDSKKKNTEENPFAKETFNATKQGQLMNADKEKARELYKQANGKYPPW